jgi:pimeloyl-ACP methyl ester carboxylesterase
MQRHPSMRQSGRPNNGRLDKREGPTMTNLKDNAAAAPRTTVRIPTASGDELEAWLYLPEGDGPHPAVVMAHGIGGIKAGGLARFAERFREEGFVAIAFDYRNFGGSGGKPREVPVPRRRREPLAPARMARLPMPARCVLCRTMSSNGARGFVCIAIVPSG